MLLEHKSTESRLVLDGQQRLTTATLLLLALCDRLEAIGQKSKAAKYRIYCDEKLLPTMLDRPDFSECVSQSRPQGDSSIIQAKLFFSDLAETLENDAVDQMVEAVLNRLSYTAFVVHDTASIQSIYEKMAQKQELARMASELLGDLYSCVVCYTAGEGGKEVPSTHFGPDGSRLCSDCAAQAPGSTSMTPGIPMSPVDVVRNFVFDHYSGDAEMKLAYTRYWSPMEVACGEDSESIEQGLVAFLEANDFPVARKWDLCTAFQHWFGKPGKEVAVKEYVDERLQSLLTGIRNLLEQT